jgi:hypothetical protein
MSNNMMTRDHAVPTSHRSFGRNPFPRDADELAESMMLISGKAAYRGKSGTRIKEQIDNLGGFAGAGLLNSFTGDSGLWGTTWGGQGAAGGFFSLYYLLNTVWFNRIQRYTARYLYLSNGIASACAYYMAVLALGQGFQYHSKDPGVERALEEWLELRNYHEKSKRMFIEYIIQGEEFVRIFGDDFRVIDPDYIYSTSESKNGLADRYQGILSSTHDGEDVTGYEIHDSPIFGGTGGEEFVPKDEMQYRVDLMFNERRGRSHFLPVFPQMFKVDQLSCVLLDTAQTQGKFAFFRKWDSPVDSVKLMEDDVHASAPTGYSQAYAYPPYSFQQSEHYPSGAVVDVPKSMTLETIGADNFAQWIEPINLALRLVATQCGLPAEIISQNRGDSDSYAAAIVANSWQEKVIKAKQDRWMAWDLDLISRCTGIDKKQIQVTAPQISTPDKNAEAAIINGAIDRGVMSLHTARIRMDLDPDEEEKLIEKEQQEKLELLKQTAEISGQFDAEAAVPGRKDGERAPNPKPPKD